MLRRPLPPLLVALALTGAGCLAPGADDTVAAPAPAGSGAPTFAPETEAAGGDPATSDVTSAPAPTTPGADPDAGTTQGDSGPSPAASASPTSPTSSSAPDAPATVATAPAGPRDGVIDDPAGDLAGDDPERAPAWADVVGATIRLHEGRGEIVLRFAGQVPATGRDGEAVNVATFHDLTGDGRIDREIWASQTSDGWGTSYWDRQADTVRFADEDEVDVEVDADTVRLSFPAGHLADATTGRWQVTLEWVDQALLTQRLAVDDAPDDRGGARWGPTDG